MRQASYINAALTIILSLFISSTNVNAETGAPIIVTTIALRQDGEITFFHKDLFSWHAQIEEQIKALGLDNRTPERIKDIRRTGHCFKTGECQKEFFFSLPIESLAKYSRFYLLTIEGNTHPVKPLKIEASALTIVYPDDRFFTRSSLGSANIYAKPQATNLSDRALIFALPNSDSRLIITHLPDTEKTRQRIKIAERRLFIDGKAVLFENNTITSNFKKATVPFEISFSDRSEHLMAITWSADSPCENNFSLIRVDGDPIEYQWLGWNCDL